MTSFDFFEYRNNELFCEDVKIKDIVDNAGSPAYIYSKNLILKNYTEIRDAFADVNPLICFSVKANSNLSVIKVLADAGSGFDVVSGGELYRVLKIGVNPDKIVFAGVGKTSEEIKYALENDIFMFNVESPAELANIDRIASELNKRGRVALRINPDIDAKTHDKTTTGKKENKFGIDFESASQLIKNIDNYKNIDLKGIHVHLGSPIYSSGPYVQGLEKVYKFVQETLDERGKQGIEYVNIGGGYCISYTGEKVKRPRDYATDIIPVIKKLGCKVVMEPGRFIIGNAGILVTRTTYVKVATWGKKFVICDAAMNDLARPSLYDAVHRAWPVDTDVPMPEVEHPGEEKGADDKLELVDIVGPVCESSDVLAKERWFPDVKEGGLIAFFSAGAYGFTMSSSYNTRPRTCEILVDGDSFSTIRKRETYEDLITGEKEFLGQ
ncbi:MAG: diaminopimelate decarboxylase [Candidatus Brocadiaceae bacterium]|nr:diaminopimelate decarboxylase [Candidatus Brocadiaceae bacterium]